MTNSSKTRTLTAVLVAATASIAAIAATTQADTSPPTGGQAAPAAGAQQLEAASFAVFRRTAKPGDTMPAAVQEQLGPIAEREQTDVAGARAVAAIGLSSVWAIPGPDRLCLAIPDPVDGFGVNCKSYAEAAEGALWVALVGGADQTVGDARMAIFVPDGVQNVTAVAQDGARRTLGASDNAAVADLANSDRVEFTDAGGDVHSTTIPGTPPALVAEP